MAKLKVFCWSDGFHVYTVAATSRAKVLAAWGVARDLFKDGEAREIVEGADLDAALAKPGETIRRGLRVDVGKVSSVAKPRGPGKAERDRLKVLERDLDELRTEYAAATAKLADRRHSLDAEAADLETDYAGRSRALLKRVDAARRKLGKA